MKTAHISLRLCVGLTIFIQLSTFNIQLSNAQEPVHLVNVYGKAGYVAMFDNLNKLNSNTLTPDNVFSNAQLLGGGGAGIGGAYELELGAFRLNAGLEFEWLNSSSRYAFMAERPITKPYDMTYQYWAHDFKETRNIGYVNLPVTVGAQFNRYFFMVGAKVGYGFPFNYKTNAAYDVVAVDNLLYDPLPIGSYSASYKGKDLRLKQPYVAAVAEFGIDLDEWLQAQPDRRQRRRTRPGERLPFGREHIHYKASVFAEYSVLNGNATNGMMPLDFADNAAIEATSLPTVLGTGEGSTLNNLFVGVKFAVQFEIPGKAPRAIPPAPSYTNIRILDEATGEPIPNSSIYLKNLKTNKISLKTKVLKNGVLEQKVGVCKYEAVASAPNYYPAHEEFEIIETGSRKGVTIRLKAKPVFTPEVVADSVPKAGDVFILQNLFFATNETKILRSSEETMRELTQYLLTHNEIRIKIIGHTDSVGSEEANQKLSEGRANAVMESLIKRGIEANRLEAEGRGESQPIDTNDTEEGRQNNRRVEIEIL